ncbi:MAG: AMP-binding protein [Bacteroidales bacterium]|nr:AMP-binding protein [Bacteroidales bacterium]
MLFEKILNNFTQFNDRTAFVIEDSAYSYNFLKNRISSIYKELKRKKTEQNDAIVIYTYNNIDTYAAIISTFLIGATFIPINSAHPTHRNQRILNQISAKEIISTNNSDNPTINPVNLADSITNIILKPNDKSIAYILFTSGSTGVPKGVKISYKNINSFIVNFKNYFKNLTENDRFLQIYDLTFDASLHCYLLPLFLGASVYTVSPTKLKFIQAYKIMDKYKLTFAKFPPSVLHLLLPYFNKIKLEHLKYNLLGGEEFKTHIAESWQKCVPNGQIYNVYGPTEATINTHIFPVNISEINTKSNNGIISIGKTFGENKAIIVDEKNNKKNTNEIGELCLGGEQVAIGYFNDTEKTNASFLQINETKFYKTGDLAYIDKDNDFIYIGRKDNQVQIQGYRVELSEIEKIAANYNNQLNYVAVTAENNTQAIEIFLFTLNLSDLNDFKFFLNNNLPAYMLPSKIINLKTFPLLPSGKIDKNKLKEIAKNELSKSK